MAVTPPLSLKQYALKKVIVNGF